MYNRQFLITAFLIFASASFGAPSPLIGMNPHRVRVGNSDPTTDRLRPDWTEFHPGIQHLTFDDEVEDIGLTANRRLNDQLNNINNDNDNDNNNHDGNMRTFVGDANRCLKGMVKSVCERMSGWILKRKED